MFLRARTFLLAFLVILALPIASNGNTPNQRLAIAGIPDSANVKNFLARLQDAIRSSNANAVASMVHYPIKVFTKLGGVQIERPNQLIQQFSTIFDSNMRKAILCQKLDELGATEYGVLIANGAIYFNLVFQGESGEAARYASNRLMSDEKLWKLQIIAINDGLTVKDVADNCR